MRSAAWQRLDHLQPVLVGILVVLGLMTIYSAHAGWVRQIVWVALGIAAYVAAAAVDYRRLRAVAPWIYVSTLALLLAVRFAGQAALGAQRWLSIGGFPLEPSELSKLMLVLVLAAYLSRLDKVDWRLFFGALALVAPAAALILTQPDLGTTIVVVAVLVGMLFLAGARLAQLVSLAACAAVAIPLLPHVLHGYQRRRLEIFLNPSSDPLGAGYNLLQARIAVGAGGLFGQGWLHGLQGAMGFVPERATDFVFAVFAEQFGLLGSLLLLAVFGTLLIRILRSAAVASDRFGALLAAGVFVMIFVQVVENVGMNIGLLPIAGIPLPMISYGGSATITTFAALGLVQSVTLRRPLLAGRDRTAWSGNITVRAQA
jgi:rod shape determining protein RodA